MKEKARSDREVCISIGKIEGEAQVTSNDTGWSEEEKERMRQAGYDDMNGKYGNSLGAVVESDEE